MLLVAEIPAYQLDLRPSRRNMLAAALPLCTVPLYARPVLALDDNKVGNCLLLGGSMSDCGMSSAAVRQLTATPGQGEPVAIRFGGTYTDPRCPDGSLKVTLAGTNAIIVNAPSGSII